MITVEQCEETCLGTRSSLDSTEPNVIAGTFEIPQIPKQFLLRISGEIIHIRKQIKQSYLQPQRSTFADSRQLRRLEMGEAKRRQVLVLFGKLGKAVDDDCQFLDQQG